MLRERGFAVATVDWRGQGLSQHALRDKRKGHVRDFSEYEIDLDTFMKEVVLPDCPPPFLCARPLDGGEHPDPRGLQSRRWFDRIVLSAPMIGSRPRACRASRAPP